MIESARRHGVDLAVRPGFKSFDDVFKTAAGNEAAEQDDEDIQPLPGTPGMDERDFWATAEGVLEQAFKLMDVDSTGRISRVELIRALGDKDAGRGGGTGAVLAHLLGAPEHVREGPSRDAFVGIFSDMDADESKDVSLDELLAYVRRRAAKRSSVHAQLAGPPIASPSPPPAPVAVGGGDRQVVAL